MSMELKIDEADIRRCTGCGRHLGTQAGACPECSGERTWAIGNFGGPLLAALALLVALIGFGLTGGF